MKEEEEESWHPEWPSKYCVAARAREGKEVRIIMIYSNPQVGIVISGDFTGDTPGGE